MVKELSDPNDKNKTSFHLIAPSIPGFGFSPAPEKSGVGPTIVARAYKILMTEVLGYSWFVTQGGDFGSFITRSIAIQFPDVVRAQHLNMFPVPPPTLWKAPMAYLRWCLSGICYSHFEHEALRVRQNFETDQSGYLEQQKTRPQTLGFALGDSPVGLLAWFVEKFHDWVDVDKAFSNEDIITLVMMHWIQGATPGLRFYREAFGKGMRDAEKTFETYVSIPTGVTMYAKEQLHVSYLPPSAHLMHLRLTSASARETGPDKRRIFNSGESMSVVDISPRWNAMATLLKICEVSSLLL